MREDLNRVDGWVDRNRGEPDLTIGSMQEFSKEVAIVLPCRGGLPQESSRGDVDPCGRCRFSLAKAAVLGKHQNSILAIPSSAIFQSPYHSMTVLHLMMLSVWHLGTLIWSIHVSDMA